MTYKAESAVSRECVEMEQSLSDMLARVERRRALPPVNDADGEMNRIMEGGLRDAVRLTHTFMKAAEAGYSPLHRARKLVALSDGLPRFIEMLHGLEGDKKLSPLFERVLDREYNELKKIVGQMRDTVVADSNKLLAVLPAEQPRGPDPFSFIASCMMMPFALACGVVAGVAQGFSEAQRVRTQPPEPVSSQKPAPHLQLVRSQEFTYK